MNNMARKWEMAHEVVCKSERELNFLEQKMVPFSLQDTN